VLSVLERSVQVDLIASYDLATCSSEQPWRDILDRSESAVFDQFPVEEDGRIVGVLKRGQLRGDEPLVRRVMRPLDDSILVAASTGVLSYIHLAAQSRYHLVVKDHRIRGIVTPSDLLKLPVRLVLFTLITHLESTMGAAIKLRFAAGDWQRYLSEGRRQRLATEDARLKKRGVDNDLVFVCQLCDKRDIIARGVVEAGRRVAFARDLKDLEKLRNDVMHSSDYVPDGRRLSELVQKATYWINQLENA
jgi:hypothetical protein